MDEEKNQAIEVIEDTSISTIPEQEAEIAEEEEYNPLNDRVFGMPRTRFHFTALGLAFGYILAGIIGLFGVEPSVWPCILGGGLLGYFLSSFWEKKVKQGMAAQAENQEQEH